MKRDVFLEFIEKSKKIHKNKYDYSLVEPEYIHTHKKITIICPEHGLFTQRVSHHLNNHGCADCAGNKKLTTKSFIQKAKKLHQNKFNYSLVDYINSTTEVKIICYFHKEFKQIPVNHLQGAGCPMCAGNIKSTKEEFEKKANQKHNNKYDYSKVVYINSDTKVNIICPEHGLFTQVPYNHLIGNGCPDCADIQRKLTVIKKSSKTIINKFVKKHGSKYDYSKIIYNGLYEKIEIICSKHGIFKQTPANHLKGGCPDCSPVKRITQIEAIKRFTDKHGSLYDYSLVKFINNNKKVEIICKDHGMFKQSPEKHWNGNGCPKCIGRHKSTKEFIEQATQVHGNKYIYDEVEYKGVKNKIKIICPKHGPFYQTPQNHIRNGGRGCGKCAGFGLTNKEWIDVLSEKHNNKYNYFLFDYKGPKIKVKIICPDHGIFEQTADSHKKCGCPKCRNYKGELEIERILLKNNINFISQKRFKDCKYKAQLPFDFYLVDYNILIEYDGEQHFRSVGWFGGDKDFKKRQEKDVIKTKFSEDNNIALLRIKYTEFENIEKIITEQIGKTKSSLKR